MGYIRLCCIPPTILPAPWLSPNLAPQYEVAKGIFSAVLGAWIWDVLLAVGDDVRMFKMKAITLPNVIYVCSRLLSGGFVLGSLIYEVTPHEDCALAFRIFAWLGSLAIPCNCFLFFLRVRGVFLHDRWIVAGFFVLWLSTLGSFAEPFGFQSGHIGPTQYCLIAGVHKSSSTGFITLAIFDTSVFVGISLRVISYSIEDTWRGRLKMFLRGKSMGNVSRALLQTGQMYYLVTVWVNLTTTIILLTSLISPTSQAMLTIPNLALQNAMACRVFRLLKLGYIREDGSTSPTQPNVRTLTFRPPRVPNTTFASTQESTLGPIGEETEDVGLAVLGTKHHSVEMPSHPHIQISIVRESDTTVDTEKEKNTVNMV
ncbi:unnamed protein product [Somion occarium]|uniref:Transmembrane protein n=1 Tax=Somion occarium TaxID=3059160 RepID=A0ABP1DLA2_9APHY